MVVKIRENLWQVCSQMAIQPVKIIPVIALVNSADSINVFKFWIQDHFEVAEDASSWWNSAFVYSWRIIISFTSTFVFRAQI